MDDIEEELAKLTSDLVKIDSSNPPGRTRDVANFLMDYMQLHGFSPDTIEVVEGKTNLIVKAGSGRPILILAGHMDVVPPGERSLWRGGNPFSGEIVDGRIYGRGATDMKGGLAVIAKLFTDLAPEVENKGSGTLVLLATADEEVGGTYGMKVLIEQGVITEADAAIVAEPSGVRSISVGEKGLCQVKLSVRGRPAHGSIPIFGDNAIFKSFDAVVLLKEFIDLVNNKLMERLGASSEEAGDKLIKLVETSSEILAEEAAKGGLKVSVKELEEVVAGITFNPGVMRCGSKINIVPDSCEVEVDMRLPVTMGAAGKGESTCRWLVDEALSHYHIIGRDDLLRTLNIEILNESEPNLTDPESALVKALSRGVREVLGTDPLIRVETGATDGRFLRLRGIPTAVYGPGEPTLAHAYNEYVLQEDLVVAYKAMSRAIRDLMKL